MVQNTENPFEGRIELNWPGKHCDLEYIGNKWTMIPYNRNVSKRALLYDTTLGNDKEEMLGHCVKGDSLSVLDALHNNLPAGMQLIYFDTPRLNVFQSAAKPGYSTATWLSLIRQTALKATSLLGHDGFLAVHTDEQMAHYSRMVLEEVFGPSHYVGTFAWQKQYAPQNDHSVPTDVFDYITVFCKNSVDDIEKIGILVTPKDLKDDGDFRGCYIDGHKGARSGSEATKFKVNTSPYHWEIVDSNLPMGNYYFDKILGSLWFETLESTGDFFVRVKATDKKSNTTEKTITFKVREASSIDDTYAIPDRIWWLLKNDNDIVRGGKLSVCDFAEEQLCGIKGQEFSLVFKAEGGEPFTMKSDSPGAGRYWEFGLRTLVEGIARAKASFGRNGTALPSIKKYFDRTNAKKRQAVMNFLPWYDFGDTQDATQHCKSLKSAGLVEGSINMMAKPQKLIGHLISLLAPKAKDRVLSIGDTNAVFASVAMKMGRKFIHLIGCSPDEQEAWNENASKRLTATFNGLDTSEIEGNDALPEARPHKGHVDILRVSESYLLNNTRAGDIEPFFSDSEEIEDFYAGLAGAYRTSKGDRTYTGMDGRTVVVVPFEDALDSFLLDKICKEHKAENLIVVYESSEGDLKSSKNVKLRRAPFELI